MSNAHDSTPARAQERTDENQTSDEDDEIGTPAVWGSVAHLPEEATVEVTALVDGAVRLQVRSTGGGPEFGINMTTLLSPEEADDLANDLEVAAVEVAEHGAGREAGADD